MRVKFSMAVYSRKLQITKGERGCEQKEKV